MVTVKGTEISDQLALDSIKAMERLVYLYRNPNNFLTCPLCNIKGKKDCSECPWDVITGQTCILKNFYFHLISLNPRRTRNRIRQLRRWIKIYQKALKEKK